MSNTAPQLIQNLSNAEYHKRKEFSSSQIKDLGNGKTPAHFFAKHLAEDKAEKTESTDMLLGTTVHALLLEGDKFDTEFAVKEKVDGRTKAGKEYNANFAKQAEGKTVINKAMYEQAKTMSDNMKKHPVAKLLNLPNAIAEASIIYQDDETGLNLRVRPDFMIPPCEQFINGLIVDVKTTGEANHSAFAKTIYNFGYHISASMYCDGFMKLYDTINRPDYLLLVVEREAPYAVIAYQLDEPTMQVGNQVLRRNLAILANCQATGQYPAYPSEPQSISLPSWALNVA